jgi:hypothetical protein
VQSNAGICGVEQTVERPAAGLHPDLHDAVFFHRRFDLVG